MRICHDRKILIILLILSEITVSSICDLVRMASRLSRSSVLREAASPSQPPIGTRKRVHFFCFPLSRFHVECDLLTVRRNKTNENTVS